MQRTTLQKENSFADATASAKVELNVTVVGDVEVGKTAFVESFLFGNKVQLYFPTLIDLYACTGLVEFYTTDSIQFKRVKKLPLWITDCSGNHKFDVVRRLAYVKFNVVFALFDLTDRSTLEAIENQWALEIAFFSKGLLFPPDVFLVGTHVDRREEHAVRHVSKQEGQAVAARIGARGYFECNALQRESVVECWTGALHRIDSFLGLQEAVRERYHDRTIQFRMRAPRDACSAGHVSWDSGTGFVPHSVPAEWRTFLGSLDPAHLNPVAYPQRARARPPSAPPKLEIVGLDETEVTEVFDPQRDSPAAPAVPATPAAPSLLVSGDSGAAHDPLSVPEGAGAGAVDAAAAPIAAEAKPPAAGDGGPSGELPVPGRPRRRSFNSASARVQFMDRFEDASDRSDMEGAPDNVSVGSELDDAGAVAADIASTGAGAGTGSMVAPRREAGAAGSARAPACGESETNTKTDFYWQSEMTALARKAEELELQGADLSSEYLRILEQMVDVVQKRSSASPTERWKTTHRLVLAYNRVAEVRKTVYSLLKVAKRALQQDGFPREHQVERHELLGQVYQKMAWMLRCSGKADAALVCMYKALEAEKSAAMERISQRQRVRQVPSASTHLHMSALLSQLGRHVEALQHAQLAVAKMTMTGEDAFSEADDSLLQVLLGTPKRGALAVAYHNVAVEQEFLHQRDRALENYEKAVELAKKELGEDHKTTQLLARSLCNARQAMTAADSAPPVRAASLPGSLPIEATAPRGKRASLTEPLLPLEDRSASAPAVPASVQLASRASADGRRSPLAASHDVGVSVQSRRTSVTPTLFASAPVAGDAAEGSAKLPAIRRASGSTTPEPTEASRLLRTIPGFGGSAAARSRSPSPAALPPARAGSRERSRSPLGAYK